MRKTLLAGIAAGALALSCLVGVPAAHAEPPKLEDYSVADGILTGTITADCNTPDVDRNYIVVTGHKGMIFAEDDFVLAEEVESGKYTFSLPVSGYGHGEITISCMAYDYEANIPEQTVETIKSDIWLLPSVWRNLDQFAAGTPVTLSGAGFAPNAPVKLMMHGPKGKVDWEMNGNADAAGFASFAATLPYSGLPDGLYYLTMSSAGATDIPQASVTLYAGQFDFNGVEKPESRHMIYPTDPNLKPGAEIVISASGYAPGEPVLATYQNVGDIFGLNLTNLDNGKDWASADANGNVKLRIKIPDNFGSSDGKDSIVLQGFNFGHSTIMKLKEAVKDSAKDPHAKPADSPAKSLPKSGV